MQKSFCARSVGVISALAVGACAGSDSKGSEDAGAEVEAAGSGGTPNDPCADAGCVEAGAGDCAEHVRLVEWHTGTNDYLILENTGNCRADLSELEIVSAPAAGGTTPPTRIALAGALEAGATFIVAEPDSPVPADLLTPGELNHDRRTNGYVILCLGRCRVEAAGDPADNGDNVIDAVMKDQGGTYVFIAPPAPVIGARVTTVKDDQAESYLRVGYMGQAPTFSGADWSVGAATYPSPPTGCAPDCQCNVYRDIVHMTCPGPVVHADAAPACEAAGFDLTTLNDADEIEHVIWEADEVGVNLFWAQAPPGSAALPADECPAGSLLTQGYYARPCWLDLAYVCEKPL